MNKRILIAPSTDPCPIANLIDYCKELIKDGADMIHCDIMDGKFVSEKTYDEIVFSLLKKRVNGIMDVHLMMENPMQKVPMYVKAGADYITLHIEALNGTIATINALNKIRELGVKSGLALKPHTPVSVIENYLPFVDLVLIMSVEPGLSGQKFDNIALPKIAALNSIRQEKGLNFLIEVDGGINLETANAVVSLGADVLVSGSAVYNSENRAQLIEDIKKLG